MLVQKNLGIGLFRIFIFSYFFFFFGERCGIVTFVDPSYPKSLCKRFCSICSGNCITVFVCSPSCSFRQQSLSCQVTSVQFHYWACALILYLTSSVNLKKRVPCLQETFKEGYAPSGNLPRAIITLSSVKHTPAWPKANPSPRHDM